MCGNETIFLSIVVSVCECASFGWCERRTHVASILTYNWNEKIIFRFGWAGAIFSVWRVWAPLCENRRRKVTTQSRSQTQSNSKRNRKRRLCSVQRARFIRFSMSAIDKWFSIFCSRFASAIHNERHTHTNTQLTAQQQYDNNRSQPHQQQWQHAYLLSRAHTHTPFICFMRAWPVTYWKCVRACIWVRRPLGRLYIDRCAKYAYPNQT